MNVLYKNKYFVYLYMLSTFFFLTSQNVAFLNQSIFILSETDYLGCYECIMKLDGDELDQNKLHDGCFSLNHDFEGQ